MNKGSQHNKDLKGLEGLLSQVTGKVTNIQQQKAIAFLTSNGLPTRKTEVWKYTDLKWINQYSFTQPQSVSDEQVKIWLAKNIFSSDELAKLPRLVTVNGKIYTEFSTLLNHPSFDIQKDTGLYGNLACPDRDVMTALNYAMGGQAVQLKIAKGQQGGTILLINLGYATDGETIAFHPRFQVVLDDHAQLSIVEFNVGSGIYFTNPVCEFIVGPHADLQYNKLVNSSLQSYICSNAYISLADHAKYRQFLMTKGAAFSRQEVYLSLKGEWSDAAFHAVQTLSGKQHADITALVSHLAPHCRSEQNVKNILSDRSHGVFQGKVYVDQHAQKTDAQQQNQALLLSDQSEINTKPELEIYADDVKCSHGATVGALDQEQLFFLMSRGIPHDQARQILINAFIAAAVDVVEDPIAKTLLKEQLGVEIVEDIT
ncbi:Fe-S cluster assembly protein SufD [Commensalibacter oyaizuii]|uniref:Fe-S cluster assembly protein SufD n=1 Tax=Commensalibacter oyaizuii TaxID=3043873 RepID=A0ABT6PZV1_9PROT|nr:Fe-S cluster assembly protein SufD [Commensalibacter sp. TBRC 16381]MDI2090396.1 Fe-S cluster assembly protein SufD [Commensalibacter sp. TBRC 16381]